MPQIVRQSILVKLVDRSKTSTP